MPKKIRIKRSEETQEIVENDKVAKVPVFEVILAEGEIPQIIRCNLFTMKEYGVEVVAGAKIISNEVELLQERGVEIEILTSS